MEPTYKYRAHPETEEDGESALYQIDLNREVYNHALTQHYKPAPDNDKPSYTTLQNKLPQWKLEELGVDYSLDVLLGLGESESTPAETVTAVDTLEVSASYVIETGSLPSRDAGRPASPHAG